MGKSKTLDEKIKELQEKLKNTELLKKQATQRKGLNLWNRIKILFLEDETIVDELLKDKEKLEIIKENIKKVLNKLFPEKLKKDKVVFCGSCQRELTIEAYKEKGTCPFCHHLFNPNCKVHYNHYFRN